MLAILFESLALLVVIVMSTGVAIDTFERLSKHLRIKRLLLASILVGLTTSLPELFIGITAAMQGKSLIALGDIMGANLANLSLVVGGAALLGGSIAVVGEYLKKDLWITLCLALSPLFLMMDGRLSRTDGAVLIFGYLLYVNNMVKDGRMDIKQLRTEKRVIAKHHLFAVKEKIVLFFKLIVTLGILAASSSMLIKLMSEMASGWGVSDFWIGLVIVSLGTTLPEMVLSLEATIRKETSLVLGNLLGGVVVNSTLILGIVGLVGPTTFPDTAQKGLAGLFLVAILGLFWLFTKTKRKLDRWEGTILIGVYMLFVGLQVILAKF